MIIGRPQPPFRSTYLPLCILSVFALASLGLAARAQQTAVQPAAGSATPTTPGPNLPHMGPRDPLATQPPPFSLGSVNRPAPAPVTPAPSMSPATTPHQPGHPPLPGQMITRPPNTTSSLTQPKDNVLLAEASGPGHEGIKVHGHWKLEVHNPDGTFVKKEEFENSLVTPGGGDLFLSTLLNGSLVIAYWNVVVGSSTATSGLCGNGACLIYTTYTQASQYWSSCSGSTPGYCNPGLTTQIIGGGSLSGGAGAPAPFAFQLMGSVTPASAGTITNVSTAAGGCTNAPPLTYGATQCLVATGIPPGTPQRYSVTSTTLPTPLTLAAGQVLTVTVTISFS